MNFEDGGRATSFSGSTIDLPPGEYFTLIGGARYQTEALFL